MGETRALKATPHGVENEVYKALDLQRKADVSCCVAIHIIILQRQVANRKYLKPGYGRAVNCERRRLTGHFEHGGMPCHRKLAFVLYT